MKRGQAAIELLLILGFSVLLLLPFVWTSLRQSQVETNLIQADKAVSDLANAAEYVYAQGVGSVARVRVTLPPGVQWNGSYIGVPPWAANGTEPHDINLRMATRDGYNDVWRSISAPVRGSWPSDSGVYLMNVYLADDGYVVITPYLSIVLTPHTQYVSLAAGNSTNFPFWVSNYEDYDVDINITKSGEVASWLTLSNTTALIPVNEQAELNTTVTVPGNASPGLHYAQIIVEGANTTETMDVTVNVYSAEIVNGTNFTKPTYNINLYKDPAYSIPEDTFYQGRRVKLSSSGWAAASPVTIDIQDPSSSSVSGYPTTETSEADGTLVHYWNPVDSTPGTHTAYFNDSVSTVSTTFEVISCG